MDRLTELIFLYLDGEASPDEQQELFTALSENDELQQRFHQALQMQRAFDAERARAVAPPEVKDAVYAALGIVIPSTSWMRRLIPTASISAAIGGIAIAIALLVPSRTIEPPSTIKEAAPLNVQSTLPSLATKVRPALIAAQQTPMGTPSNFTVDNEGGTTDEIPQSEDVPTFTFTRKTHPLFEAEPFHRRIPTSRVGMIYGPMVTAPIAESAVWSAQVAYRGSLLANSAPSSLQNFSVVAFYRLDENNRLGIEFRRAPYTLNIAQPNATITSASLSSIALAYSFHEPSIRIVGGMPFVQPSIGLTELGPVAAITAGLHFPVTRAFNLSVGFDGSALVYSNQVASALNLMVGINVGLPIR